MRQTFLDGLRGWAALCVVFHHTVSIFIGEVWGLNEPFMRFFRDGTLAVYVFFVISGFALSTGYVQSGRRKILISLALRRYPRLAIPVIAASFGSYLLLSAGLMRNHELSQALSNYWLSDQFNVVPSFAGWAKFAFARVFLEYVPGADSYDPPLWTMWYEFKGSFILFACLAVVGRGTFRFLLYAAALAICAWLDNPIFAFFLGTLCAELWHCEWFIRRRNNPLCSVIGLGLILPCIGFEWRGGDTLTQVLPCCAMAFATVLGFIACQPLQAACESRVSRWMGRISFPLYLIHMPVIASFTCWLILVFLGMGYAEGISKQAAFYITIPVLLTLARAFEPVERAAVEASRRFALWMQKATGQMFQSIGSGNSGA